MISCVAAAKPINSGDNCTTNFLIFNRKQKRLKGGVRYYGKFLHVEKNYKF